jgi:hypothetical protein
MRSDIFSFFAGIAVLTLVLIGPSGTVAANPTPAPQIAIKAAPAGPLPPIPYEGYPAPRPMPVVQAVYEFAARHPEVLQYQPCFCGCDHSAGHKSNVDCFVHRRGADGRILEWDSHGYGCAVCIDVARDSMRMFNSGASVSSIRAAIDQKYGARGPSTMKTPKPPGPAAKAPAKAAPAAK